MAAPVEQRVDVALAVTADDDRLASDVRRLEAAGFGELTLVCNPHPCLLEDLCHLELEDLGVGVHAARYAIFAHQVGGREVKDLLRGEVDGHRDRSSG